MQIYVYKFKLKEEIVETYDMAVMEILPGETPKQKYDNLRELGSILFDAGWIPGWTKKDITELIQSKFSREQIEKLAGREL